MKWTCFYIAMTLVLAGTNLAFGHGFELDLDDNQITAVSEVQTISQHLFVETLDVASSSIMFSDHGGVEAADEGQLQVPGDSLGIQFLSPLWYSNGGAAVHATTSLTMNATSYDTSTSPNPVLGSVNITGAASNAGSFPVIGNDDHSIGWILSNSGSGIPAGAFGFSYRVTGLRGGDAASPFAASDPLVVIFNTPSFNGSGGTTLNDAQTSIFDAIMQGDFNLDGSATTADTSLMLNALSDLAGYQALHNFMGPADLLAIGDLDRDGAVTNADVQGLLNLLANQTSQFGNGATSAVPEPGAGFLAISAVLALVVFIAETQRKSKQPHQERSLLSGMRRTSLPSAFISINSKSSCPG
ncbi:MAG TPA: hypothetical protein VGI75_08165 [Pirellulales bacterium]|jgi:hypothetical protein